MLLGAAVYSWIVEGTVIKGNYNEPVATRSALGWHLTGETPSDANPKPLILSTLHVSYDLKLDELLQKFWVQEEVPAAPLYTDEDWACEEHIVRAYLRNEQGQIWLIINLSQSVYSSRQMLLKLEKKFSPDDRLKKMYHDYLKEFEDLGHMSLGR